MVRHLQRVIINTNRIMKMSSIARNIDYVLLMTSNEVYDIN